MTNNEERGEMNSRKRDIILIISIAIITSISVASVLAPLLAQFEPTKLNSVSRLQGPSYTHWFGTDGYGRDLYSRVIYGARVSLLVGAGVTILAIAVGLPLGLLAGWFRTFDAILMRFMDGLMAIPGILLAIAVLAFTGGGVAVVIVAIAVPEIPQVVRLVRGVVMSTRSEAYIEAARLLGTPISRTLWIHLLPTTVPPVIVQASYIYASAILMEAGLSFLGVGVGTETPTWGNIMGEGRMFYAVNPWIVFWPALALSLCILSINIIGDALRDFLDPKMSVR